MLTKRLLLITVLMVPIVSVPLEAPGGPTIPTGGPHHPLLRPAPRPTQPYLPPGGNAGILARDSKKLSAAFCQECLHIQEPVTAIPLSKLKMDRVPATGSIFFPSAHAGLDHDAEKVLSHVSELLTKSPALGVTIVGYADNSGSKGFNAQLSQKRASSIRDILKTQYNIPEDRVKIYWSGDKNAYGDNAGPQGRAMNRRADILFNFKEDPDLIPSFTTSTGQAPIENMSK